MRLNGTVWRCVRCNRRRALKEIKTWRFVTLRWWNYTTVHDSSD
jgi:hypothetical protein